MDEAPAARRPTKLVVAGVLFFLVAVLLARLLIEGGVAWIAFGVMLPVVLLVLTARSNLWVALVGTALFVGLVFLLRWVLQGSPSGWVVLLLLPVVAFTALLVGRVLGQMRADRRAAREGEPDLAEPKQG